MIMAPTRTQGDVSHGSTRISPRDLLEVVDREQDYQLNLCATLERIADELPSPVDRLLTSHAIDALRQVLPRQSRLEENYLFPALRKVVREGTQTEAALYLLSEERQSDECLAQDIAEYLEGALQNTKIENPDMLGYMLRHFFECRRRHIAWCRGLLLPLARRRLTARDLKQVTLTEVENRLKAVGKPMPGPESICGCGQGCDS